MGLRDRYQTNAAPAGSASPAKPETTPVAAPAPAPASATTAVIPTTQIPPTQARDLAAMRARLAGGQLGGVNSPEGAEKITEALVTPRTQETADGGAEPISAPSAAPAAPAPSPSHVPAEPAPKRKRGKATAADIPGEGADVIALLTEIRDLLQAIEKAR